MNGYTGNKVDLLKNGRYCLPAGENIVTTTSERTDLGLTDTTAGCRCCSTASAAESVTDASATSQDVLVDGMTCSHCVMSVTEEISAIDGVEDVAVDLNAGGISRVTIHSSAPIDAERVRAAVEEAGYALARNPS